MERVVLAERVVCLLRMACANAATLLLSRGVQALGDDDRCRRGAEI
jgi:hypothetical protein